LIDVAYITALILVFLRVVTFFVLVPVFFPKGTPNTVKIMFSFIFAYILMPGINYTNVPLMTDMYPFIYAVVMEVGLGLTLGFITNLCFESAKIAGAFLDVQIGFSMMSIFDPNSGTNSTLLENLIYFLGLVIFLIINGHHILIKALMESFSIIGLGKFIIMQGTINLIVQIFIQYFIVALKIAIPIILVIMITDIIMGLISRSVPSLNLLILGMPLKIFVGLLCFMISLPIIVKMLISSYNMLPSIYNSFYKTIPLFLIFAADDKTEEATPKKKADSKKKGQVPRSKDVSLAITLMTCLMVLTMFGSYAGLSLKDTMSSFLTNYMNTPMNYTSLQSIILLVIWRIGLVFVPIVAPILVMGVFSSIAQTGFLVTGETIKPKLSKLNPLSGFKKMFSKRTVVETIKDILIVFLLAYVGYSFIKSNFDAILNIGVLRIGEIPANFGKLVLSIFFQITLIMLVIGLFDFIYQRLAFNKENKMSKQEVKEEYKQQEGDPQVKSKIRQRQRELGMKRMMQAVPKATVVITNPTHLAVALKYNEGDSAPVIIAKGADYVAIKIKEIAKDNEVPIIENRPLARMLYEQVDIDSEVPVDMYQAVAQVLAIVLKMKK